MLLVAGFLLGVMFARRKRRGEVFGRRKRLRAAVDALVPRPPTGELIRARFESRFQGLALVHPCPREGTDHVHAPGGVCIHTVRAWLDREGLGAWEPRWDEGTRRFGFVRSERGERKER